MPETIDIRPTPELVRTALAHCQIPLVYTDQHTAELPATAEDMGPLLSAVVTMAMVKHTEDTMVLPSNASALRDVSRTLRQRLVDIGADSLREDFVELAERLDDIAANLDTRKEG